MGLDAVEIVMTVEDAFEIKIENKEAEKCITPRDVIDLVMSKVQSGDEELCLTQRSFHLLRRVFLKQGINRSQFRLSAKLEQIFPNKNRRHAWDNLSKEVGASIWPSLKRPDWLEIIIWISAIALAFWLLLKAGKPNSFMAIFAMWLAAVIAIAWIGYFFTRSFASFFPKNYYTVEQLVSFLAVRNPKILKVNPKKWSRMQVAATVRKIVIDILGCKNYREEARFVEDLGMG